MRSGIGLLGVTLLALLGCGCSPQPTGKRVITFWGVDQDDKGSAAVVREFERIHPDIEVKVLNMGAGGMNPQKLMTSIVGRVPPDIIYQDRFTISDWASRGAFRPLDDLIARDKGKDPLTPTADKFYPAAWEEASYEGHAYAIPARVDDRALYWNRGIFRQNADRLRAAGLDPERAPRTWSELLAYSKVLTLDNPDGSPKQFGYVPNYGNSWLYIYAFENNARFLTADGRKCTLDSPEVREALDYMKQGYSVIGGYERFDAFQSGALGNENDQFIAGKIAMKVDGDWILDGLSQYGPTLDLGVAPPPVPDDRFFHRGRFSSEKQTYVTWSGGFSLAIPTGAQHVDDAWNFIKWYTSKDACLLFAREQSSWERLSGRTFISRMAANIEANREIYRQFRPADKKFAAALKMHIDLMPAARTRPPTLAGQVLWNENIRAVENACTGRMSVSDALQVAQEKVQYELDQFYDKDLYGVVDLRWPLLIGLGLVLLVGGGWVLWIRSKRLGRISREETRWAYLFVSPWLLGFLVLTLGPMLSSLFFSFTQWNVLSDARWVGLKNYADLGGVDRLAIGKALFNAAYMAGIGVPLGIVTGLAVAVLLNAAVRGMASYRTMFYLPSIVPGIASAVLWMWILSPDPHRGLINAAWVSTIGAWMHLDPPGWLSAESWSKPALVFMGLWGAGSGMILWLAGLKSVPSSLYEAANMDGASPGQQFWNVTLPHLTPLIFFNTVMGFIGALQEFDRVYILTGGLGYGPGDSLATPVYHLFTHGFTYFRMGYASALAWLIFAIILVLTLIQFRMAPRWVHYEAEK